MEYPAIYIVWALVIPFPLFVIAALEFYKAKVGKKRREYYSTYFPQGVFSALVLGLSIFLDHRIEPLLARPPFSFVDGMLWHFLLFPALLLLCALAYQRYWPKPREDRIGQRSGIKPPR